MFYDKYVALCKRRGISPSRAAVEAGLSKSLVSKWKHNKVEDPSPEVARKVADYFNITLAQLLQEEEPQQDPRQELKFALWGSCADITDDDLEDVLAYAAFVRERKKKK